MFSSSISFLHLNIQSLVPKLDLITTDYADFDILSFSESWLNRSHTGESLKLSNYQTPFRKDRGPNKSGGGVILHVKDNTTKNNPSSQGQFQKVQSGGPICIPRTIDDC